LRLIALCEEMNIHALSSPSMTGDWEAKLNKMEKGEIKRDAFMQEINQFTTEVVEKARTHMQMLVERVFPDLEVPCPACGAPRLKQTDATYECRDQDSDFRISKHIAGRKLSEEEAKELFTKKELPEMEGFMSRFNKPFSAGLKLTQSVSKTGKLGKWKTEFVFETDDPINAEDLMDDQIINKFTLPNGSEATLYETDKAYHVPELKTKNSPEGFRLGKTILKKELQASEVVNLFSKGKTSLLDGFISKRTKRPFKAHLTLDLEAGKIGFEFAPRPVKKAAKTSS
jgi:DNA topoisomerase-3